MLVAIFRFVRINGSLYIHVWVGIITQVVQEGGWDYGEHESGTDRRPTRLYSMVDVAAVTYTVNVLCDSKFTR